MNVSTVIGVFFLLVALMLFIAAKAMTEEYKRGLADARKAQLSQEERKLIEEQHKEDLAWRKAHPRTVTVWGDEYIPRFSATWDGETVKCEVVKE